MSNEQTGTMAGAPKSGAGGNADPGLVLVYAERFDEMPPVILATEGSIVIGREPPPGGVKLPLTSVSRTHARLHRRGDRCTLNDLGSRNGVLVRGRAIESRELVHGDDVRIGDALFVFVADGARLFEGSRIDGQGETPFPYAPVACGPATRRVYEALVPIAVANIPVLVLGETGTGKEQIAQAVHAASKRRGELRALNCAAIPGTLMESELFGYKRGAFTGADRDSPGIARAAHEGTLFLDEVGDLPLDLQPKLLRLLESNEVAPVGASRTEKVDVRIVCATHADLDKLVAEKKFRADLYSRIRGYVVRLPPLRERKEDLYRLVRALLARLDRENAQISVAFMMALGSYDWPFNVRELFGVLRRATAIAKPDEMLDVVHLPEELTAPRAQPVSTPPAAQPEQEAARPAIPTPDELREALRANDGNVAALARIFRRDRSLIHRWLKQHGIDPDTFRKDG